MQKIIAIFLAFSMFLLPVVGETVQPAVDEYEYVFSEAELREFLTENIDSAIKDAVAETTRKHMIELLIKDSTITNQSSEIANLISELEAIRKENILYIAASGVVGFLGGCLVGYVAAH
jgi:hypothetical protein